MPILILWEGKKVSKFTLPDSLYSYQKEDSNRMCEGSNWFNFSEMGVGKTPTALQVIEKNKYQWPLIVCPNPLRLEWKRQIEDWIQDDYCAVSHPDSYYKLEPILKSFFNGQKYKIINYETFRTPKNVDILKKIPFDCIIFDEIHKVRNPKTNQVKGLWKFLEYQPQAKIIGLSGSPIMNYPNDLYVPLSIIDPGTYPKNLERWRAFMYKYCMFSDGRYGAYIYGTRSMKELKEETSKYIIRRTKKEVLPFLPDKYYRRVTLEMKPDQRKLYNAMEKELKILLDSGEPLYSTSVLSTLTRLRQLNLDPKVLGVNRSSAKTDFLVELVQDTDDKIVVFSCFEKYIYLLHLIFKDTPHVCITGKIDVNKRSELVRQFQEDPKIKLCLGTIQTMGEGLTLTEASNVVMMDRWWNQPVCDQAIDRLHRIGQKNAVQVVYPIVMESIDELLDQTLEKKSVSTNEYYSEAQVKQDVLKGKFNA